MRRAVLVLLVAVLQILLCQVASAAFWKQALKNDLAAGNDAKGIKVTFNLPAVPPGNQAATVFDVQIKDRNGGNLVVLAATPAGTNWSAVGGMNVIADPAMPGDAKSYADFYWRENNPKITVSSWKWLDINNGQLGDVKTINAKIVVEKPAGPGPLRTSTTSANVSFLNAESGSVVFSNIRVYTNQPLGNYSLTDFATPVGTATTLSDVTVSANSQSSPISIGTVNSSTYQLVLADCHRVSDPSYVVPMASGVNVEEVLVAPGLSGFGEVVLIIGLLLIGSVSISRGIRRAATAA
jgi:hypothetical protein